jgi:hypothetical protein
MTEENLEKSGIYEFGDCELEADRRALKTNGSSDQAIELMTQARNKASENWHGEDDDLLDSFRQEAARSEEVNR